MLCITSMLTEKGGTYTLCCELQVCFRDRERKKPTYNMLCITTRLERERGRERERSGEREREIRYIYSFFNNDHYERVWGGSGGWGWGRREEEGVRYFFFF